MKIVHEDECNERLYSNILDIPAVMDIINILKLQDPIESCRDSGTAMNVDYRRMFRQNIRNDKPILTAKSVKP